MIMRASAQVTGLTSPPAFLSQWYRPNTVGGSTADATAILAHFRAVWNVLAGKIANGAIIVYDPTCIAMEDTTGTLVGAFTGTQPANSTGIGGSSPLPYQTQGLISWETNGVVNGRRLRGRWFIPFPDEADNSTTQGVPGASYTSQLTSAVSTYMSTGAGGALPAIWHRPSPGGSNGTHAAVTGGSGRAYWSVQRKRR